MDSFCSAPIPDWVINLKCKGTPMTMESTKEEVKLPKHLQAAVNQLQKQIDKFGEEMERQINKRDAANATLSQLTDSISALSEQIKRLKGSSSANDLIEITSKLK